MPWKVIESKHGDVVRTYERQTEWAAIQVAIKIARREGLIRADEEGEDFIGLQSSWTVDELREQLSEFGDFDDGIIEVEIVFEEPKPKEKEAEKEQKPKKTRDRPWTYAEAARTLPYVRRLLASIRQHYVAASHFRRLVDKEPDCGEHQEQMWQHGREGAAEVDELISLGVSLYDPLHGIAFFTVKILEDRPDGDWERIAYLIYREGRRGIDSYVLHEELDEKNDLPGTERKVPAEWKTEGSPLVLKTAVKS